MSAPSGENLDRLDVDGLEPAAAERLLSDSADSELGASARRELEGAAGNPLALIESPRTLSAEQLAGREPMPKPIRPSSAIERSFRSRLAALDEEARRALTPHELRIGLRVAEGRTNPEVAGDDSRRCMAVSRDGYRAPMETPGSDQEHFGEASLGEAQSDNPPDDPEMINDDAEELDTDVEDADLFVGDDD